MKTILLILLVTFSFKLLSQTRSDVKTPNYSNVIACIMPEDNDSWRYHLDTLNAGKFPNARFIYTYPSSGDPSISYSSTRKFNCHGFAWYMSSNEGSGLNEPDSRWIGKDSGNEDEHIYWEDGSYTEIPNIEHPCVISYDPSIADHSAISQSTSGKVVSKWADGPLMYHDWDDCPFMDESPELIYYKRNCNRVLENITISNDHSLNGCTVQLTDLSIGSNVNVNITFDDWTQINGEFLVPIGSVLNVTP